MIAAFLLILTCANPDMTNCQREEAEVWHGPTSHELDDCATMAASMDKLFITPQYLELAATQGYRQAMCQIEPMRDDRKAGAKKTALKF